MIPRHFLSYQTPIETGAAAAAIIVRAALRDRRRAPAVIKKDRFPPAAMEHLLRLRWWELELSEPSGLPFRDIERCLDRLEEIRSRQRNAE
jgi:hypothetical protein